mmetsp:Transcript_29509/g.96378  ORF Transcript_29509/g.96378 Transcript_29509/m.96378 type:complete len:206 (-) Transcript_29509:1375-1992(-)
MREVGEAVEIGALGPEVNHLAKAPAERYLELPPRPCTHPALDLPRRVLPDSKHDVHSVAQGTANQLCRVVAAVCDEHRPARQGRHQLLRMLPLIQLRRPPVVQHSAGLNVNEAAQQTQRPLAALVVPVGDEALATQALGHVDFAAVDRKDPWIVRRGDDGLHCVENAAECVSGQAGQCSGHSGARHPSHGHGHAIHALREAQARE